MGYLNNWVNFQVTSETLEELCTNLTEDHDNFKVARVVRKDPETGVITRMKDVSLCHYDDAGRVSRHTIPGEAFVVKLDGAVIIPLGGSNPKDEKV